MTTEELERLLAPTIRLRLAKPILVQDAPRFAAGDVVEARLTNRDEFAGEIRISETVGDVRTFCIAGFGDLEGAELASYDDALASVALDAALEAETDENLRLRLADARRNSQNDLVDRLWNELERRRGGGLGEMQEGERTNV